MGQTAAKTALKKASVDFSNDADLEPAPLNMVPEDILLEILARVPARDIIRSCVCVCKQWNSIIESKTFWIQKCVHERNYPREIIHLLAAEDFKKLFFLNPYGGNLIQNSCAEKGLEHWHVKHNGGDGWKVETPTGCDPIVNYTEDPKTRGVKCWVTSYGECTKSQTIDLLAQGCSEYVLDELRPDICISEWYAGRFDCSMTYILKVQLFQNLSDKKPLQEWRHEDVKAAGKAWFQASHRFTNYSPGVRFIRYSHMGVDRQFWKGWYGAKMTLSTVKLDLSHHSHSENPKTS